MTERKSYLGTDSARRKGFPMCRGLLDYFPDALAAVAEHSRKGNDKHNPGEELHHARGKSMDHADCIMRHLANRGGMDGDSRESVALAWRALALLQEELEQAYDLPLPRGARDVGHGVKGGEGVIGTPRHDLTKQVATLGADSLLPPARPIKMLHAKRCFSKAR